MVVYNIRRMNKRDGPLLQKVLRTSRNKRRKKMNEIIKNIEAAQLKAEAPAFTP